ncbi:MAG TPA: type II toxin-antitoxin system VapC family toxin [Vicinamibacterales bacterium]|nr:type II toxin-antitoxin system VapC family toxin [Vicinamibacterales bacterium]HOQ60040.1 type II toxin-antitoxin system VapC family toxin [Vicinamibacterales bacterium]HPK71529.1 type II toxin-antitoxin system VapC family toxin [Vicinamibacterales bacterium]
MVNAYFDSSVLVAFYLVESHSYAARRAVTGTPRVLFTPLHQLEVRNTFRVQVGRERMTSEESEGVLRLLEEDVAAGRLAPTPLDLYAVFERAEGLSAKHTRQLLSRSLDVLHVAAALELGCTRFVSFDARQVKLAAAAGLRAAVPPPAA